eukprot:scaffold872_cov421-Prasinococcus_capsulatus_cf.AAC.15
MIAKTAAPSRPATRHLDRPPGCRPQLRNRPRSASSSGATIAARAGRLRRRSEGGRVHGSEGRRSAAGIPSCPRWDARKVDTQALCYVPRARRPPGRTSTPWRTSSQARWRTSLSKGASNGYSLEARAVLEKPRVRALLPCGWQRFGSPFS